MRMPILIAASVATFALLSFAQDTRPVGRQPDGAVIVPTHQILRPFGDQVEFPGRPTDLAFIDKGKILVVKNRTDLVFIDPASRVIRQTLAVPTAGLSFHGIAVAPDDGRVYVTGATGHLWVARYEDGVARFEEPILLPGPGKQPASAPGGIALRG